MGYILKLGGIDVSDYVEAGYKFDTEPVYGPSFPNMLGQEVEELIGYKVSISANLGEVPAALAKSIMAVCNTDKLSVDYATPIECSATFKCPKITSQLISEDKGGSWDISISMSTDVILKDGL